jgi:hypothetical protein
LARSNSATIEAGLLGEMSQLWVGNQMINGSRQIMALSDRVGPAKTAELYAGLFEAWSQVAQIPDESAFSAAARSIANRLFAALEPPSASGFRIPHSHVADDYVPSSREVMG